MNKKITIIFIVAFLIRLINLNQSLWLDETITARVIQQYSHWEIVTKFSPFDFHPPLYYLFMKSWSIFFGCSEIALRMPSVIFSILTGYVVYLIAGKWAAVFFLFNPLIVYYSQEARPYMMVTFLLTTSLYYLIKLLTNSRINESTKKTNFFFFIFSLFLSFFTFYGSLFFIAAVLVYLFYKKKYKGLILTTSCLLLVFFIISPLLYRQLINARISFSIVKNWNLVLGKANIKNLLLIPVKFSIGRIDFYPKWLYYSIAGLWTIFIGFKILSPILKIGWKNQKSNFKSAELLYFLLVIPLLFGFVVSFVTPMLQYFRFLYLIPIISILLSFGAKDSTEFHPGGGRGILAGFLIFSLIYLLVSNFHREDWKNLIKKLPADRPVYMVASSADPVFYYNPKLKINDLVGLSSSSSLPKELIVIPYTAEIYGYNYRDILEKKNYHLVDEVTFRDLYFEQWNKK